MASLGERISQTQLRFTARAGSSGKLYGSITAQDIAAALSNQLGVAIDRRKIEAEHLREVGTHRITVRLSNETAPELTVVVRREGEEEVAPIPEAPVPIEAAA
jgi:large subunit ribosomal protein L9